MPIVTPTNPPACTRLPVGAGLVFAVFGAPVAWLAQLIVGYALASHACYPLNVPLVAPVWDGLWWMLLGVDLAAALLAIAALLSAMRFRRVYRDAAPRNLAAQRNRFIANWSLLVSALFSIAVVFTIVMLFIEPVCNH
jgi:hypothetical protein